MDWLVVYCGELVPDNTDSVRHKAQLISLHAVLSFDFVILCPPQLCTPKEITCQSVQLELCDRPCLSWLIAVTESCLGSCVLRCVQRLLSDPAFFKVLATERLQLISWWAVDAITTFCNALKTSYCIRSLHSGWSGNATIQAICLKHISYEQTLLLNTVSTTLNTETY